MAAGSRARASLSRPLAAPGQGRLLAARSAAMGLLLVAAFGCASAPPSDRSELRQRERDAFALLQSATSIVLSDETGWFSPSQELLAFGVLLESRDAAARFEQLVACPQVGAATYGLCGLRLVGSAEQWRDAWPTYLAGFSDAELTVFFGHLVRRSTGLETLQGVIHGELVGEMLVLLRDVEGGTPSPLATPTHPVGP